MGVHSTLGTTGLNRSAQFTRYFSAYIEWKKESSGLDCFEAKKKR